MVMGSKKSDEEKEKVVVENRKTKRLPPFVTIRTQRKLRDNPKRRNWRRRGIKMKTLLKEHSVKARRLKKSK